MLARICMEHVRSATLAPLQIAASDRGTRLKKRNNGSQIETKNNDTHTHTHTYRDTHADKDAEREKPEEKKKKIDFLAALVL